MIHISGSASDILAESVQCSTKFMDEGREKENNRLNLSHWRISVFCDADSHRILAEMPRAITDDIATSDDGGQTEPNYAKRVSLPYSLPNLYSNQDFSLIP